MSRRALLLIVNPVAGGKPGSGPGLDDDPSRLEPEALAAALRDRNLDVRLHELREADDAGAIARQAADEGDDIVVAGGDGTVSAVAAAVVGHATASIGILGLGSFNNIARGYGLPETLDEALEVIARGRSSALDVGWVVRDDDGTPFFEAAGVGLDAIGFLAVELAGRRGWWRGLRAVWRALRLRSTSLRVTIDDVERVVDAPAVTVSNGPYHGPGLAVADNADPTDGLLDVAVFRGMTRLEVLGHFAAVAGRRARHEPRIDEHRAARVTIEGTRRSLPAHADGESIGVTPVTLEVRPGALRVFR